MASKLGDDYGASSPAAHEAVFKLGQQMAIQLAQILSAKDQQSMAISTPISMKKFSPDVMHREMFPQLTRGAAPSFSNDLSRSQSFDIQEEWTRGYSRESLWALPRSSSPEEEGSSDENKKRVTALAGPSRRTLSNVRHTAGGSEISRLMPGKHLRRRKRTPFTNEDNELLTHLRETLRTPWQELGAYFPNRASVVLRKHYEILVSARNNRLLKEVANTTSGDHLLNPASTELTDIAHRSEQPRKYAVVAETNQGSEKPRKRGRPFKIRENYTEGVQDNAISKKRGRPFKIPEPDISTQPVEPLVPRATRATRRTKPGTFTRHGSEVERKAQPSGRSQAAESHKDAGRREFSPPITTALAVVQASASCVPPSDGTPSRETPSRLTAVLPEHLPCSTSVVAVLVPASRSVTASRVTPRSILRQPPARTRSVSPITGMPASQDCGKRVTQLPSAKQIKTPLRLPRLEAGHSARKACTLEDLGSEDELA